MEQRCTSHNILETSPDKGDRARLTAASTSPLLMSSSLLREADASMHSGRVFIDSTDAFSNMLPLSIAVPISNTLSRNPFSALMRSDSALRSEYVRIRVARAETADETISDSSALRSDKIMTTNTGNMLARGSRTRGSILPRPSSRNGFADLSHRQMNTMTAGIRTSMTTVRMPSSMAIEPNNPPIPITGIIVMITSGARMQRLYTAMQGAVRDAL